MIIIENNTSTHSQPITPYLVQINNKNKYRKVILTPTARLKIEYTVKERKARITKQNLNTHRPTKYTNREEYKEKRKQQKRDYYHNHPDRVKHRKDIDKTLSINTKASYINALKPFFSEHYPCTHFVTLQSGFMLDYKDAKVTKTKEDYEYNRQQNKYQIQPSYTLNSCKRRVKEYINNLVKDGQKIYSHYIVTYHKSHYDNTYHAHLLINIIDDSIVNKYTFLYNRWKYSQKKKQMVKKIYNQKEILGYMMEEKKRLNATDIVDWDTDITKETKRIYSTQDLTKDFGYWFPDNRINKAS